MSDIVERARNLRGGVCTDDCYDLVQELADEIERLQDCNKARDHETQGLYAEIERLQALLKAVNIETQAEIERLGSLRSAEITAYNKRIDELDAEIERLRSCLLLPIVDIERRDAEIKRLQSRLAEFNAMVAGLP